MTQRTDIKRLNDGSIDYAHYIARSQAIRRHDADQVSATISRALKAVWNATRLIMVFRSSSVQSNAVLHQLVRETRKSPFPSIRRL